MSRSWADADERRWLAIELDAVGKLTSPALIAAFEGWNDAGEAASSAITQLTSAWDAKAIGEIDPEDYYDFQVTDNPDYAGPATRSRP